MLEGRRIVVVEDDEIMGASLVHRLELEGAEVHWHRQVARALPAIRTPRRALDAVVCDVRLPDGTGEELYHTLTRTAPPPPFLFITGAGTIDQAVRLIQSGAADYLTKPFDMSSFLERLALVMRPREAFGAEPQTGISQTARELDRRIEEAARRDAPVLIRGGPGLGKARLARRVHDLSDRSAAPFLVLDALGAEVDAAAIGEAIERAGEGTLLLIGLGRLPSGAQGALHEALRGAEFRLLGTAGTRLEEKAAAGGFRADLLDRLRAHEIIVPPLADRPEDAVWLAGQLFPALNLRRAVPLQGLAPSAEEAIREHDWPGNGRELRARMVRAVEAASGEILLPSDLFPERGGTRAIRPLAEVRESAERAQIAAALEHTGGHVQEAARLLRVSRTTLWEKMQRLGLSGTR